MQLFGREPLPAGTLLICSTEEQYQILSLLGCGGSGLVYRARRISESGEKGALLAIKECFPAPVQSPWGLVTFLRGKDGAIKPSVSPGESTLRNEALEYLEKIFFQMEEEAKAHMDLASRGNAHLLRPMGTLRIHWKQVPGEERSRAFGRYFAMEDLQGQGNTYSQMVHRVGILSAARTGTVRQIPVYMAAKILSQVLIALSQIHRSGYLFGDLQEGNLFFKRDEKLEEPGFCCLLDFGSAKKFCADSCKAVFHPQDFVFSTPGYTPPELIRWDRKQDLFLGPEADLYAVGRLFSKMVTGQDLFRKFPDGRTTDVSDSYLTRLKPKEAARIQCGELLRGHVNRFLDKALAPEPGKRYQTAEEMLAAVGRMAAQAARKEPVPNFSILNTFIGRQSALDHLVKELDSRQPGPIFLYGLGGIGKTETMLKLTQELQLHRPGAYVPVFAPFRGTLQATIAAIPFFHYDQTDPLTGKFKPQEVLYREKLDLLHAYGEELLLLIDNWYDEEKSYFELRADKDFSVVSRLGHVIFTTRYGEEEEGRWCHIGELPEEELYELMCRFYQPESENDARCLRELIQLVEGHTYTVDLLARSLAATGNTYTPEELLGAMSKANSLDIRQLPRIGTGKDRNVPKEDAAKQQRLLRHLCSLWNITALNDSQKQVMACACLIPSSGMDLRLFRESFSEEGQDALDSLLERGWILCDGKPKSLRLHMTVKQVCRQMLSFGEEQYRDFLESLWQWWNRNRQDIFREHASEISLFRSDAVMTCMENAVGLFGIQSHFLDYFEKICTETSNYTLSEIGLLLEQAQRMLDAGEDISQLEEESGFPLLVLTDKNGAPSPWVFLDDVEYQDKEYVVLITKTDLERTEIRIFQVEEEGEEEAYYEVKNEEILRQVFDIFADEILFDSDIGGTGNLLHFLNNLLMDGQDPLVPKPLKDRISDRRRFLDLEQAAKAGDSQAMFDLGDAWHSGKGTPKDREQAVFWYQKAASCGHIGAMMLAADAYSNGKWGRRDPSQALYWYLQAAKNGDPQAMYLAGKCYRSFPSPDDKQAVFWYEKAAKAGIVPAMIALGNCCCDSIGCVQDYAKAFFWFKKAHEAGNPVGTNNLGWLYLNGCGCTQDYKMAKSLFEQAVQGSPPPKAAFRHLGEIYRDGLGVAKDPVKAYQYLSKGEKEDDNGGFEIQLLKKHLL